jgi:hypothetical protein
MRSSMSQAAMSSSTLRRYERGNAPRDVVEAARPHEQRIGREFASLTVFPRAALDELHLEPASGTVLPPGVRTARADAYEIRFCMATLTETANGGRPDEATHGDYRRAILRIFDYLPDHPRKYMGTSDVVCVAPEREGRLLADELGCLMPDRSRYPHAKRIAHRDGLVVGLTEVRADLLHAECMLIDDVVASGATAIAILGVLSARVDSFRIFVAHATLAGLWAISRYAEGAGLDVTVNVGHVSGRLASDYSVVDPAAPDRPLLGHVLTDS